MISAIVVCGGSGLRFAEGYNKVLYRIDNKPIYQYSVDLLLEKCDEVIIVCKKEEEKFFKYRNCKIVYGGDYRHLSVLNGLNAAKYDTVLIHDGARPHLQRRDLDTLITKLDYCDAAFLAIKPKNTIKTLSFETLDRSNLIEALTPQGGLKKIFIKGINKCIEDDYVPTDDIAAIERLENVKIEIVFSSEKNFKITTKEDIYEENVMKIGHSFDIHQLVENRDLYLGGIKLDFQKGLLGHSDADCLLHAISESFLGALALGDLGSIFPDTDPKYKDIDSKEILCHIYELVKSMGYIVTNIDSTVYLELPKMKPHILDIRKCIASILDIDISIVSVKATTYEKLGPIGEGKAIAAEAVCLLKKITK